MMETKLLTTDLLDRIYDLMRRRDRNESDLRRIEKNLGMANTKPAVTFCRKGERMESVTEFVICLLGQNMFYKGDKLQNPGWAQNWTIHMIENFLKRPGLFHAIPEEGDE